MNNDNLRDNCKDCTRNPPRGSTVCEIMAKSQGDIVRICPDSLRVNLLDC